jgi:hypothetical protein
MSINGNINPSKETISQSEKSESWKNQIHFENGYRKVLMSQISLPPQAKQALWKALKAGVQTEFPTSKQGTPQGGCISPLLANIALHGLADLGTGYTKYG